MIELQRAKLGLPPAGTTPSMTSSQTGNGKNISSTSNASNGKQPSPIEVATATLLSEDAQIERFINRLQRRDRKTTSAHQPSSSGPTVPSALSRRMLQRQGVGYLDDTVASVVSASADRFLATVLQQSIACRDQRLKGAAMAREASKQRKRHTEDYEADADDRKRRKDSIIKAREDIAMFTIEQAELIKKGGGTGKTTAASGTSKKTSKKKKGTKNDPGASSENATKKLDPAMCALAMEESEEEYDSIDEEEEYYQENVAEVTRERIKLKKAGDDDQDDEDEEDEDEDSDEEDDTLLLRDIVRPLKAWNFHLNGKEAIQTDDDIDAFENIDHLHDGTNSKSNTNLASPHKEQQADEKGKSDTESSNVISNGTEESKQQSNEKYQGDPAANGNKNGAAKKNSAATPASSSTTSNTSTST